MLVSVVLDSQYKFSGNNYFLEKLMLSLDISIVQDNADTMSA